MIAKRGWQFWIDRGGTFTDIIGRAPDGRLIVDKRLSESAAGSVDPGIAGLLRAETAGVEFGVDAGRFLPDAGAERIVGAGDGVFIGALGMRSRGQRQHGGNCRQDQRAVRGQIRNPPLR